MATLLPVAANADPVLKISVDNNATFLTVPGSSSGEVVFNGSVGGFIVNVVTGLSKPLIGSASQPQLDLNSVNVSGGVGTIDIWLSDVGFASYANAREFIANIGGTTSGKQVSFATYIDPTNTAFGSVSPPFTAANLIGSGAYVNPAIGISSAFALTYASNESVAAGPYSLTLHARISHTAAGQVSSFDDSLAVPEPGTLVLLGIGLLGLAGLAQSARRRG